MSFRRVTLAALVALLLSALGYGAYWFHVAGQLRKGIESWAEHRRAAGWEVAWTDLSVDGFPTRVRARMDKPRLARPDGASWATDALTATASPFDLTEVDILAPGRHLLAQPGMAEVTATAEAAQLHLDISQTGALEDANALISSLVVAAEGKEMSVGALALGIDPQPVGTAGHQEPSLLFSANMQDIEFPADADLVLDRRIALIEAGGRVMGAVPPGDPVEALAEWSRQGGIVELDRLAVEWAPMGLEADGTLAFDPALQPLVALSARVRGYGALMDRLAAAGMVDPGAANAAKMVLSLLSRPDAQGRPAIAVPLTVQDGAVYLGPAKVGRVPVITWPKQEVRPLPR